MIIGLTGTIASGKGVVSDFFKSKGFLHFSLSDELREKAKELNIEITRLNLQRLGNKLRNEQGKGVLAEFIVNKILKHGYKDVVVDSIRNPGEVEVLKKNLKDFFLISIDAPLEIRFERICHRKREDDPLVWEDFVELDAREKGIGQNDTTQAVAKCMEMADFSLFNKGDLSQLQKQIEEIYEKILTIISHTKQ